MGGWIGFEGVGWRVVEVEWSSVVRIRSGVGGWGGMGGTGCGGCVWWRGWGGVGVWMVDEVVDVGWWRVRCKRVR